MTSPAIDDILGALADARRRDLLEVLARRGEATATTLATEVPISRQAVLKHLNVLAAAQLVDSARSGREVRYTIRPHSLDAAARWMNDLADYWDRRLDAIKRRAESSS